MKQKKILVITNMYPTSKYKSFGIFVKNQVDALKKRDLSIDVVAVTNPRSGKANVAKKYSAWLLHTIFRLLTKGKTYDVVHAHYVFPSGFLGLLFKKLCGTRLIVTAHGGDIDKMAKKSRRLHNLTRTILQNADHVIAVGQDLYQQITTDFQVKPHKLSIINMGVNRQIFRPQEKAAARESCGLPRDQKVALFVGNLLEQKGLMELVDSMNQIKASHESILLYIIGAEKDPGFKRRLDEKIAANDLQSYITFLGTKEQSEIATWMSAADCLVLPSHIEGFGLVALEAMACGTPVIGTNVGGLKTLLQDGAGVMIPVKNPEELAKAMRHVLSSEEMRTNLIKNGFKKAEENDQERMLNQVIEVYFPTGG
ncbi:glycosyltransferase family 4 protein [Bacillus tuaregi]|uniref:glycosyltransferase family 4 protein n=1 Tax=Bacillus tuaregi TaxID=1816695 RepID=UPI000A868EAA|nr:glycosyltransferase family 4 protein [Bacillus tuaregi]